MTKIYTVKELSIIAENMEKYGGSFVKKLALAMHKADQNNLNKIINTWPELMVEYLDFGK